MKNKAAAVAKDSSSGRGRRISATGVVVSDKMNKTISVRVSRTVCHKRYGKFMRTYSVFKAHDEKNVAKMGDTVRIFESPPLSKTKRWKLGQVITKASGTDVGGEVI